MVCKIAEVNSLANIKFQDSHLRQRSRHHCKQRIFIEFVREISTKCENTIAEVSDGENERGGTGSVARGREWRSGIGLLMA